MVGGEEASMERWVDLFWGFEVVAKLPTKKLGEKKRGVEMEVIQCLLCA